MTATIARRKTVETLENFVQEFGLYFENIILEQFSKKMEINTRKTHNQVFYWASLLWLEWKKTVDFVTKIIKKANFQ